MKAKVETLPVDPNEVNPCTITERKEQVPEVKEEVKPPSNLQKKEELVRKITSLSYDSFVSD